MNKQEFIQKAITEYDKLFPYESCYFSGNEYTTLLTRTFSNKKDLEKLIQGLDLTDKELEEFAKFLKDNINLLEN